MKDEIERQVSMRTSAVGVVLALLLSVPASAIEVEIYSVREDARRVAAGDPPFGFVVGQATFFPTAGFPVLVEPGPPAVWLHDWTLTVDALEPGYVGVTDIRVEETPTGGPTTLFGPPFEGAALTCPPDSFTCEGPAGWRVERVEECLLTIISLDVLVTSMQLERSCILFTFPGYSVRDAAAAIPVGEPLSGFRWRSYDASGSSVFAVGATTSASRATAPVASPAGFALLAVGLLAFGIRALPKARTSSAAPPSFTRIMPRDRLSFLPQPDLEREPQRAVRRTRRCTRPAPRGRGRRAAPQFGAGW